MIYEKQHFFSCFLMITEGDREYHNCRMSMGQLQAATAFSSENVCKHVGSGQKSALSAL